MDNERRVAISVLNEINQEGAYNNIALRRALDERPEWKPHQRAFVTELVNGTLRNQLFIDYIINNFSKKTSSKKMKPFIRELLRTAVYQIKWMDKVPPSAAVNEAVKLARASGFEALSGFVNGILRNIVRAYESDSLPEPDSLGLRYSFPKWLADRLTEEFMAKSHIPPPVTVCVNRLKTTPEALAREFENCTISGDCLHLRRVSNLTAIEPFRKGHFFVMDEGAYLAACAVQAKPGQKILDLCAAPGGKSFALAGIMENCGEIISCDIHPHKIRLMKKMASRLSISCIKAEERDASIINPAWEGLADAVLLDAPCSGLGVIRKRPDIKYTKTEKDIVRLAEFQRSLLTTAAAYVKPGGALVYCTCTLTKEENEDNVMWFLQNFPYNQDGNFIRHEGFFIARLIRK